MSFKLYGLNNCSTCQKAVAWLESHKIPHSFSDVKENPVTKKQITVWSSNLGGWEKLVNRAGDTWHGIPSSETADFTEAKAVALATKNPSLIRRPLIEHEDGSLTAGISAKVQEKLR